MRYLSGFQGLEGRRCLVVGGRAAAARKVRLLRAAGAEVVVVAHSLDRDLAALAEAGEIHHHARDFRAGDVLGCALVVPATELSQVDSAIAETARAADVPVRAGKLALLDGGVATTERVAEAMGEVAIVGAGPGDPELLTVKALRHLQRAEVIVYDRLAAPEILEHAPAEAELIYAGKAPGRHSRSQDEINALLARHALQGRRVVRLKGGDPMVFGRGGEEQDYLEARGIPVTVVPGITAATGCAAAAGIPLTHRDHAQAVTFVTGHSRDGGAEPDWAALASGGQTLVIYMGLGSAGRIAGQLMAHGLAGSTPAAVIEKGTTPSQRIVATTLEDLEGCIRREALAAPALLVIGSLAARARASAPAAPALQQVPAAEAVAV